MPRKLPDDWQRRQYEPEHRAKICCGAGRTRTDSNGAYDNHHAGRPKAKWEPFVHAPAHSVLHPAVLRAKACKAGRGMRAGTHPKTLGSVPTGAAEKRPSARVSRVSQLCPVFRTQPGAYSSGAQKTGVAPPCGSVAGTPSKEEGHLRAISD